MKSDIKKLWVEALRSGEYKQAKYKLRNGKNEFCCLGVLCNLHAQAHPEIAAKQRNPGQYMGQVGTLPLEVLEWAGVADQNGGKVKYGGSKVSLINLNDTRDKNFLEIADLIEEQL